MRTPGWSTRGEWKFFKRKVDFSFVKNCFQKNYLQNLAKKRCLSTLKPRLEETILSTSDEHWLTRLPIGQLMTFWSKVSDPFESKKIRVNKYAESLLKKHPLKELRWVTLGRHHNWLETVPGSVEGASSIPNLLEEVGEAIGRVLGFHFRLDASIINFYPANNSSIGIHRDDIGEPTWMKINPH